MTTISLAQTLVSFLTLVAELAALFIGISFLVGLLQEYIPAATIRRVLTDRMGQGNILGAALGTVTPFCSCSTIPVMVGLLNAGAPFGATSSFLLASPLLNPVILGLFLAVFGWRVTVVYAVLCFSLAAILGAVWEKVGLASYVKQVRVVGAQDGEGETDVPFSVRLQRALRNAWTQFVEVLPYLVVGAGIGAFIHDFVPASWVVKVAGPQNSLAIPVAALVGIPLYIRVETMIPIGQVLLQKGMGLGALMALIIGGAGASIPELSLLASIFKPRLLAAFVVTILAVATVTGFVLNLVV